MWADHGATEAQWREMLELAALASGFEIKFLEGTAMDICPYISARGGVSYESLEYKQEWNPTKSVSDAWGLISDVRLTVHLHEGFTKIFIPLDYMVSTEKDCEFDFGNYLIFPSSKDVFIERKHRPLLAITRAAAEVGRRIKSKRIDKFQVA